MTVVVLLFLLSQARAHDLEGSVYCVRDGETRRLTDFGAATPAWSPNEEVICYVRHTDGGNVFHFISPAGETLQTVPLPPPLAAIGGISWDPNGVITFAALRDSSFDIYRLDPDGEAKLLIRDGILPTWSPNGKALAFTTKRDGNAEIYLSDPEGHLRNLTRHEGYDARSSWSPDGTRIAFESDRFGNFDICVTDTASGETVRVTDHPGKDWNPAWSPDGREIAFSSDRSGENRIHIMDADGTNIRLFPQGSENDWQIFWSPDGSNLCFVSSRPEPFFDWLIRLF